MKSVSLYCIPTQTFALIEVPACPQGGCGNMLGGGRIDQRGSSWYFTGSEAQVCGNFGTRGWTLQGDDVPQAVADQVYRTERGFDAACRRLTGSSLAEHESDEHEAFVAYYEAQRIADASGLNDSVD